jgi:transcriptional regulator with XRE-family HTH domain
MPIVVKQKQSYRQRMTRITPAQCRMARAALQWTVRDLSEKSKVGTTTINRFEMGLSASVHSTLTVLRLAFESGGVTFIAENGTQGAGVRFKKPKE